MGWFQDTMETVGKAIPNEVSKLNSITKWIPYVGQASQVISSIDAGATAYGDTGDFGASFPAAMSGFFGSTDPGYYGSGGDINRDIWNTIGQIGNVFGGVGGGLATGNYMGAGQSVLGMFDNPYLFGRNKQQPEGIIDYEPIGDLNIQRNQYGDIEANPEDASYNIHGDKSTSTDELLDLWRSPEYGDGQSVPLPSSMGNVAGFVENISERQSLSDFFYKSPSELFQPRILY